MLYTNTLHNVIYECVWLPAGGLIGYAFHRGAVMPTEWQVTRSRNWESRVTADQVRPGVEKGVGGNTSKVILLSFTACYWLQVFSHISPSESEDQNSENNVTDF